MNRTRKASFIGLSLVILFFALLLYKIKPAELVKAMVGVSWGWVAVAGLVNILNVVVESVRWHQIVLTVKRRAKFQRIVELAHPAILWIKIRDYCFLKPKLNLG
jgi:uncharacterized membrane protein YbhN (UPF0104 family)